MDAWRGIVFLTPYLNRFKRLYGFIFVCMVLVAVTSALSAYIFKHILDDIFIAKDRQMLVWIPVVVVLLFTVRGVSRFMSSYLMNKIGVSVSNAIRRELFSHLLETQFLSLKKITTGEINALIIQTVLNIQNIISKILPQLLISFLTVIALIVVILYSDWRLALYAIAIGLLMVIPVKFLGKGVKRHTERSENMIRELSNRINETFNNIDLVKVYGANKREHDRFIEFLYRYETHQIKLSKYQLLSSPFMEFFIASAIAMVIYIGGNFVMDGSMSAGDFFAFMVALMMLYAPIKALTQNYISLFMLNGYVQRVEQILSLPIESKADLTSEIGGITPLVFENVSYAIGDSSILQDISFTIEERDSLAIVGQSGAGKSTILSLIFGFGTPLAGRIKISNTEYLKIDAQQVRSMISYVNQSAAIFNISIEENILYGRDMDKKRYQEALALAKCDFVESFPAKSGELAGEFGNRLSGGQRQRVALARAIYRDAPLFVLDEATSALDSNTESIIQQSLERIMQKRTSIIIAHRLSTIQKCNKVLVLERGRVVAYGSYDEVSQSEAFRRNFMLVIERDRK